MHFLRRREKQRLIRYVISAITLASILYFNQSTLRNVDIRQQIREGIATKHLEHPIGTANETLTGLSHNKTDQSNSSTINEQSSIIENAISNETLGFGKIFAINLPSRSDRRDLLTLMSIQQKVKLDWQIAVRGDALDKKAWPPHWNSNGKDVMMAEV